MNDHASKRGVNDGPAQSDARERATEHEALLVRYDHLRRQLVEVVCAYDCLTKHDLAQIRLDYMVSAGCWGSRELIAQYEANRCQRRYCLARESVERCGSVDVPAVEAQVASEFAPWDKRYRFIVSVYDEFAHRAIASDTIEDVERAELEQRYRAVLGRVHPALYAADDEERSRLFTDARRAFESYDLDAMRLIDDASHKWDKAHTPLAGDERLRAAVVVLEAQVEIERTKLCEARKAYPQTLRKKIDDPRWLDAWRRHFGSLIEQHNRSGARFQKAYQELCRR